MSIVRSIFGKGALPKRDPANTGAAIHGLVSGGDQRIVVKDVTAAPWRPFCCMHLQYSDGSSGLGTGVLVAPNAILTAAHNLYALDLGKFVKSGIAEVGVKNGAGAAAARIIHADICPGYGNFRPGDPSRHKFDYALARLDTNALYNWAGTYLKLSEQAPLSGEDLAHSLLNVAGYPDHEGPLTLKSDSGPVLKDSLSDANFSYTMDTMPGQSGCPVFRYEADTKTFLLAGVHVAGLANANIARRYDEGMRKQIGVWLNGA